MSIAFHSVKSSFRLLAVLILTGLGSLPLRAADEPSTPATQTATFGIGCFWCAQALFEKFAGVTHIDCGYAGGHTENPTYDDVCSDETGHAEVVQVTFDPAKISYQQLLDIFWDAHDPTTLNRQGADAGTQYRSIILFETPEQEKLAQASKQQEEAKLGKPVTTEIVPLTKFYEAEEHHQNYYKNNPYAPYCAFVISPKLRKLQLHPPETVKPTN